MDSPATTDERSKIPDLMKIGSIPSDLSQDVDTEVLDPVVIGDNFARFVLTNKGFLHSFSKITLGVLKSEENDDARSTFPVNVGIHSLIQRCALRIGTTVVAEIDDFNHWMGYKSMFIDNDINYERETYLTSRIMATELAYDNEINDQSNLDALHLTMKSDSEPVQNAAGDASDTNAPRVITLEGEPVFSVSVADLFPFLRFNQLPLYMIDQQISIELYFQPEATKKRCVHKKTDEAQGQTWKINETQVKFVADYIYYDGDLMEQYRNANRVMNWTYTDFRLNKRSFTQAQLQDRVVMDVGGAGRLCNKIITTCALTLGTPDTSLTNEYNSIAPAIANNNNGVFTNNLIYNDNRLYPIDRTNSALHFHDLVQTEQNIPHISRQMWAKEGGSLSTNMKYMNYEPSSSTEGLNGKFFYTGYRLNRNERVNSRGVQLEFKYSTILAGNYIHRTYLELVKTATLNNGKFSTEFA
jgi:hypothetical protein